jgi:hypothetical protein
MATQNEQLMNKHSEDKHKLNNDYQSLMQDIQSRISIYNQQVQDQMDATHAITSLNVSKVQQDLSETLNERIAAKEAFDHEVQTQVELAGIKGNEFENSCSHAQMVLIYLLRTWFKLNRTI